MLAWFRRSPGRWLLKSPDGQIWAAVTPFPGVRRGMFRATALRPDDLVAGQSRTRYGSNHWTTGGTAAAAKRNIENWLARNSYESFAIAAEG